MAKAEGAGDNQTGSAGHHTFAEACMTARPRALLVGNELILLRARKMILDIQFRVSISARTSEAASEIEGDPFDLIVICDDAENWKEIVELASSKNPLVKTIAVTMTEDEQLTWVDATVCFIHGPYALLKLCGGLFGLASTMRSHGFSMGGTGQPWPTPLKDRKLRRK